MGHCSYGRVMANTTIRDVEAKIKLVFQFLDEGSVGDVTLYSAIRPRLRELISYVEGLDIPESVKSTVIDGAIHNSESWGLDIDATAPLDCIRWDTVMVKTTRGELQ
jgi:hypothetical protein